MNIKKITIDALQTVGLDLNVPTLDLILKVHAKVVKQGDISIKETYVIAEAIQEQYTADEKAEEESEETTNKEVASNK